MTTCTRSMDDDVLRLDNLSEDNFISTLHERFETRKRMYTSAGTILIAVNPYECVGP